MLHRDSTWQTKDGLEIFAQCWEATEEVRGVVALAHGLGEHSGRYQDLAHYLTANGFSLYAYDQRGHGRSQGKRGHTPSYAHLLDDLESFLKIVVKSEPGKPLFLYGHSLGGNIVLNYCLRRLPQLQGVIATGPWLRLAFCPPTFKVVLGEMMDKVWPTFSQANGIVAQNLTRSEQEVEKYVHDPLVHNQISARLFTSAYKAGLWALDHSQDFPLPLLLMHGSQDCLSSAEASQGFAQKVPENCTFRLWEGYFHEIHKEQGKELVFQEIAHWLSRQTP